MGKSRLIFFDTTNYTDFPIGGQLTSVRSLLRFLCETCPERCGEIVLCGVSKKQEEAGRLQELSLFGQNITFLPVTAAETDLAHTAKSLRAAFAKGILRYGRQLHITKEDCCYLQTPEAYGPVRLLCAGASIVIFSHGSYANMERGFRFFQDDSVKSRLIRSAFPAYLKSVLKGAKLIFILDEASRKDYLPYNQRLVKVTNSVVLPETYENFDAAARASRYAGRLLFAGRLSKDKGVENIMRAAVSLHAAGEQVSLQVVGDGDAAAACKRAGSAGKGDFHVRCGAAFCGFRLHGKRGYSCYELRVRRRSDDNSRGAFMRPAGHFHRCRRYRRSGVLPGAAGHRDGRAAECRGGRAAGAARSGGECAL